MPSGKPSEASVVAEVRLAWSNTGNRIFRNNVGQLYDRDGRIVRYAWNFGDGGTGSGVAPTHNYTTVGTFTATLTVTDNSGATGTTTRTVTTTAGPPPTSVTVSGRIQFERVSMLPGPPTIYQSLLAHPERENYDLSSLRLAVTGAAAVPVDLIRRMRSELGFRTVLTAYGLTETCGVVTISGADDEMMR